MCYCVILVLVFPSLHEYVFSCKIYLFTYFNWLGYFSEETKFATWWFFDFYLYRVLYIPCWMKRTKQWGRGKNLQSMLKMNRKYPFFNPNSSVTRIVASWLQQEKDFRYFIPFLIELCIAIIEKNAWLILITELMILFIQKRFQNRGL